MTIAYENEHNEIEVHNVTAIHKYIDGRVLYTLDDGSLINAERVLSRVGDDI